MWNLPTSVEINGEIHKIRNRCDYRMVLDVCEALNDEELDTSDRARAALIIFYENISQIKDFQTAMNKLVEIINLGEEMDEADGVLKSPIMNWKHDFTHIAPPISRVLGYSVRDEKNYTHWYDFVGAYMEIGECSFSTIISIRSKKRKGKKLEKWEEEYYRENRKAVDLPMTLTKEEQEMLDSAW